MHKTSFNKLQGQTAICLFCHTTKVSIDDWNKRCVECKKKQKIKDEEEQRIHVGQRMPAARLVIEKGERKGQEIWVDKFGKEIDNPGYDLKNDPRGWKKTGTQPNDRTMIK